MNISTDRTANDIKGSASFFVTINTSMFFVGQHLLPSFELLPIKVVYTPVSHVGGFVVVVVVAVGMWMML